MGVPSQASSQLPAPGPDAGARVRAVLRAYAWAAPRLGPLSVEAADAGAGRVALFLAGADARPRIVIGAGDDIETALAAARRNAAALRAALSHV